MKAAFKFPGTCNEHELGPVGIKINVISLFSLNQRDPFSKSMFNLSCKSSWEEDEKERMAASSNGATESCCRH